MSRFLLHAPAYVYGFRLGWTLGHRFLLLTHTGRRSGVRRRTVLEVIEYRRDTAEAIVISAFGRDADWFRNIQERADFEVVIGTRRFPAVYRLLGQAEGAAALRRYQRRHRLIAPVIRAVLSRLVGWRYDGSEAHARRLVAQLPVVAFSPLR